MASLTKRLEALEERVAALESVAVDAGADGSPMVEADTFWALEGLSARVPAPGAVMIVGDVELPDERTARWQLAYGTDDLLSDEWSVVADTLAALGHPTRLELVRHVMRGVDTARELGEIDGVGTSGQVYHHLRQLAAVGWLRNRAGRFEVPPERVVPLLAIIVGARR